MKKEFTDDQKRAYGKWMASQRKNVYHAFSDKEFARKAAEKGWAKRRAKAQEGAVAAPEVKSQPEA